VVRAGVGRVAEVHRRGVELEEATVRQRVAGGGGAWCDSRCQHGVRRSRGGA
jgi:hypothetical protein